MCLRSFVPTCLESIKYERVVVAFGRLETKLFTHVSVEEPPPPGQSVCSKPTPRPDRTEADLAAFQTRMNHLRLHWTAPYSTQVQFGSGIRASEHVRGVGEAVAGGTALNLGENTELIQETKVVFQKFKMTVFWSIVWFLFALRHT